MSWRKGPIPPLSNGKHPTNRELQLMRLGYPEYQPRLLHILQHNPARHSAIMAGEKSFVAGDWVCPRCGGAERYTRNLACRACAVRRSEQVFMIIEPECVHTGMRVYKRSEEASERYQERVQRKQYLDWFKGELLKLEIICGGWKLQRGVLFQPEGSGRSQYLQPDAVQHQRYMQDPEYRTIVEFVENRIGERPNAPERNNTSGGFDPCEAD